MMFLLVIAAIAIEPGWNGLGETSLFWATMASVVGMWFHAFQLGLMYYFLPQQLNKPISTSYSLGILALWVQILFILN
ncbi:MAG: hypothetical protein IPG85_08345 [Bacteroidetes bacterium]|nr:hypothetical protein [Bacteroidota bacterium]